MKKHYVSLILGLLAPITMVAQTTIYGSMVDNRSWSGWDRYEGIYSFTTTDDQGFTEVFTDGWDLAATAGGVLVDGVYHLFNYREGSSSTFCVNYTSFDISNWSTLYSCYFSNVIVSNDMTCDPLSDMVYCAQKDGKSGKLTLWNPSNIDEITTVGQMPVEVVAIAANANGELYGIAVDGGLYYIDKTDASMTFIGDTGVTPKSYQSAVFDYSTGILYWAAYTKSGKSSLYSVDITTGEAILIKDFDNNARFCGLYTLATTTAATAPAEVEDLKANFVSGNTEGTITFTMPDKTFGGESLSGDLRYLLTIDDVTAAEAEAEAGEKIEIPLTLTTGYHQIVLVTINDAGESPRTKLKIYTGKGQPGYAEYPAAQYTDNHNEILISWKAPDYCIPLEAYYDASEVRYDVVRMPDNVKVADHISECSFIDTVDYCGPLTIFKYEITTYVDDITGFTTETNGIAIGDALEPPYEVAMASADLSYFTIIDANADGMTWCKDWYGYGVSCGGRWDGESDDWLILPPLHLDQKGVYHVIITVGNDFDGASKWELKLGKAPTAAAMTRTLMTENSTATSFDDDIKVSEDGTYYLGIHCTGAAGTTMYVTDIIVRSSANFNAPDEPINVSGVGADKGELAALVTFTTPQTSIGGDRLDTLTAVNIYHGEKLVYTLEGVEPDTEYTCKVEADQEFNEYSVAAVNEYGEGRRAKINYVFAGYDYPATVTGFTLTEDQNGKPHLSWEATPETGLFGYYVNPDDVVYEIYRGYGNDTYDLIEETYKGTEYVDTDLNLDCDQFMLTYYIYPVNTIGRGYGAATNSVCFGRPYTAPYVEKFTNGQSDTNPWNFSTSNPETCGWFISAANETNLPDIDGSNGLMTYYGSNIGDQATLIAPYISVKGNESQVLDFYYYSDSQTLTPTVSINGETLNNQLTEDGTQSGWKKFIAPLDAFTSANRIKLEFICKSTSAANYAFIDQIRVRQQYANDVAVSHMIVPESMAVDEEASVKAVVVNEGTANASQVKVTLYRNGYAVSEKEIENLPAAEACTVEFVQIPDVTFGENPVFEAIVTYDCDQYDENNSSGEITSYVKMPIYPAPDALKAVSTEEGVTLSWSAPIATSMAPEPIIEDFEDYESFAIEMSPWTLIDGDKHNTVVMSDPETWYEDLQYPHSGEPMAYQIFDPEAAGIDCEIYWRYAPHSGEKAAVCWATDDFNTANDDWLISPELYAGGQTISFYVYSRTGYFDFEKYEVLYSSTGTDTNDFTLLTKGSATDEWTKITVELPADAKCFAIHTVSYESNTEIWYDDISFIPSTLPTIPLDLIGYNVYRDNVKINSEIITDTSYLDTVATEGTHKYNVTAVYGVGQSHLSDDAFATVISSISSVTTENIRVYGTNTAIRIIGAMGMDITVNAVNGMNIARQRVASNDISVPAAQGIYIVTVEGTSYKVIVR